VIVRVEVEVVMVVVEEDGHGGGEGGDGGGGEEEEWGRRAPGIIANGGEFTRERRRDGQRRKRVGDRR